MDSSSAHAVAPAVSATPAGVPSTMSNGIDTMVGVFFVFLTLALALVYLQYHFNRGVQMVAGDSERPPRRGRLVEPKRKRGIDPELLRTLPVTVYRAPKSKAEEAAVECAVCLTELEDGEEARFLPRCGHGFHTECVDMWLASHSTCPLCRLTVGKPKVSPAPPLAILPPLRPELANYAANLSTSMLLGVSSQGAMTVSTSDGATRSSAPELVIQIPESTPMLTPHDPAKSPGSARLRTVRRILSFSRQGPSGSTPSWACGLSDGEGSDIEQGPEAVHFDRARRRELASDKWAQRSVGQYRSQGQFGPDVRSNAVKRLLTDGNSAQWQKHKHP